MARGDYNGRPSAKIQHKARDAWELECLTILADQRNLTYHV